MNLPSPEFPPLAAPIGWVLLHSLWQGALIAGLAAAALHLLRRASPALRHAVCLGGIGLFALFFVTTAGWLIPKRALPALPPAHTSSAPAIVLEENPASRTVPENVPQLADSSALPRPPVAPAPAGTTPWREHIEALLPWLAALWLAGVLALSLRHLGGWRRLQCLRRNGRTPDANAIALLENLLVRFGRLPAVRLLESLEVAGPLLVGLTKPVILLPVQAATGLSRAELEAIIAHELAHLARRDAWTNLALVVAETVFFYHPLIWWLGQRARQEREEAADDLAMKVIGNRRVYAGALARLAEIEVEGSFALAARGGNLAARIRRILAPTPTVASGSSWGSLLPVLTVFVVALAAMNTRAADGETIPVKAGESLQAAIDRAPAGAVLRLEAGEWKERIEIQKPLTLEGAGWEKTILRVDEPSREGLSPVLNKLNRELRAAKTGAEKQKLILALQRQAVRPAVLVTGTGPVKFRGMRVAGSTGQSHKDSFPNDTLVVFFHATGTITDCAITGPYAHGISIAAGSEVEVTRSLVAAVWGTGILVAGREADGSAPAGRLHLTGSDIRNCYHRCIVLGLGCDTSVIEGNRISGSAWHGIRYDDASPTITGNAIFSNARSGIYASGATQATVRGNLFWKNEMNGISCWSENSDRIEGNTFASNLREALAVLGGATPTIDGNIFAGNPVAITAGAIQGAQAVIGEPAVGANLFWGNKQDFLVAGKAVPLPAGSLQSDPAFRGEARLDFTSTSKMGAASPLSPKGPWALLAEEKAIIPADDTRDYRYWSAPGDEKKSAAAAQALAKAQELAKTWVADVFQLDDPKRREAAIARIRIEVSSSIPADALTGLTALAQLGPVAFNKAPFRHVVSKQLDSPDAAVRRAAVSALMVTGADQDTVQKILTMTDDPAEDVRAVLTGVIVQVTQGDLTGEAPSGAILKLMRKLPPDARDVAHRLWGAKLSPAIEQRVLEYTRDVSGPGPGYEFFYGALSTQANKSEATVRRLIEILADPDVGNRAGRAAWGLGQGVSPKEYPLVSAAMLRVLEARSDPYLREFALKNLAMYASADDAPGIQALLAKPGVEGEFRQGLEGVLKKIGH